MIFSHKASFPFIIVIDKINQNIVLKQLIKPRTSLPALKLCTVSAASQPCSAVYASFLSSKSTAAVKHAALHAASNAFDTMASSHTALTSLPIREVKPFGDAYVSLSLWVEKEVCDAEAMCRVWGEGSRSRMWV